MAKAATFKAATEDLVNTVQVAIQQDELTPSDRSWLIGELDELIDELKKVKAKLPNAKPTSQPKAASSFAK